MVVDALYSTHAINTCLRSAVSMETIPIRGIFVLFSSIFVFPIDYTRRTKIGFELDILQGIASLLYLRFFQIHRTTPLASVICL